MKRLPALLALALAGCAGRYEADVDRHFRHHEMTARFEGMQREGARAEAELGCKGAVQLIEGKEGLQAVDYRCRTEPEE